MLEINMKDLFKLILRKWWILIICMIVICSVTFIWTNYYTVPVYLSSTTLYVGKNIGSEGIQSSDLNLGSNLILDYRELAKSKLVANEVINDMGLVNINAVSLAKRIEVIQINESRVIKISVKDSDPQIAMELTNKVAEVFQKKIIQIMQVENVQIIDKAELELSPISPNKNLNYMIGIILGFVIGIVTILLIEYFDNTIKTTDDVQKYLNLPVIGNIPLFYFKEGKARL